MARRLRCDAPPGLCKVTAQSGSLARKACPNRLSRAIGNTRGYKTFCSVCHSTSPLGNISLTTMKSGRVRACKTSGRPFRLPRQTILTLPWQLSKKRSSSRHWRNNLSSGSGICSALISDNMSPTQAKTRLGYSRKSAPVHLSYYCIPFIHTKTRNSTSSKLAKTIITRLTNKQNLGGTRLIRGYAEVQKQLTRSPSSTPAPPPGDTSSSESEEEELVQDTMESTDFVRKIDHLVLVVPGAGQRFSRQDIVRGT